MVENLNPDTQMQEQSPLKVRGFSDGEDYRKVEVLRYMPLDRFLALLELEAMWFSRLGALQDKFECTNPLGARAVVLKLAEDAEQVEKCKALGMWDQMVGMAEHGRTGDDGRKMFVINCWCIGTQESPKMWQEYGDGGRGVAIRSTVARLASVFRIPGDFRLVSFVGRVSYIDFRSHLGHVRNDVADVAFKKDNAFKFENEVRVLTLNKLHSGCLYPDGNQVPSPAFHPEIKGFYISFDLRELIQRVILGPKVNRNFRIVMKRIVSRYGLNVEVEPSQRPEEEPFEEKVGEANPKP